jgi:HAD superfamily hydrolase (TIGR01549 family)
MHSAYNSEIGAIIWDYDGTLVDTQRKNYNVTRKIVQRVTQASPDGFDALRSEESYTNALKRTANWREFYKSEFGLTETETDIAGRLWAETQLDDDTPTTFYDGVRELIIDCGPLAHGVVSQNSRLNILRTLERNNLRSHFKSVIGYEEVDIRNQKPEPDGLLMCLDQLMNGVGNVALYIGDHDTDIACALKANEKLKSTKRGLRVVSIGVTYSHHHDSHSWKILPDFSACAVAELQGIIKGLSRSPNKMVR